MCIIPDLANDEQLIPVTFSDEVRHALSNHLFILVVRRTVDESVAFCYSRPGSQTKAQHIHTHALLMEGCTVVLACTARTCSSPAFLTTTAWHSTAQPHLSHAGCTDGWSNEHRRHIRYAQAVLYGYCSLVHMHARETTPRSQGCASVESSQVPYLTHSALSTLYVPNPMSGIRAPPGNSTELL